MEQPQEMDNQDIQDLRDYARDHYETFGAYPCEFEASSGRVYNADEIWKVLQYRYLGQGKFTQKGNGD